jgi:hypothetical protein
MATSEVHGEHLRSAAPELDGLDARSGYSPHEHRPIAAYAGLTGVFGLGVIGASLALRRAGRTLPERPSAGDVVLLGMATHKLSRLITKDKATSFLRAPFTRFQESTGHGEVSEEPRGEGAKLVIGELLVCPYCLAQWISAGLTLGLLANPRLTRMLGASYTALTLSDFLQLAYRAAEERA